MNQAHLLFLAAEAEVSIVIQQAAASAAGDPWRALECVREWADIAPGRRMLLVQATRYRVGCPPTIAVLVDQVVGELGEDVPEDVVVASVAELTDPLESPSHRLAIDREVAAAAAGAIRGWIVAECRVWREERAP